MDEMTGILWEPPTDTTSEEPPNWPSEFGDLDYYDYYPHLKNGPIGPQGPQGPSEQDLQQLDEMYDIVQSTLHSNCTLL